MTEPSRALAPHEQRRGWGRKYDKFYDVPLHCYLNIGSTNFKPQFVASHLHKQQVVYDRRNKNQAVKWQELRSHRDTTVYDLIEDTTTVVDPKVCAYEAASNAAKIVSNYEHLIRKYESNKFYRLRTQSKKYNLCDNNYDEAKADAETANIKTNNDRAKRFSSDFNEFLDYELHESALSKNKKYIDMMRAFSLEGESTVVKAETYVCQMRDARWRTSKYSKEKKINIQRGVASSVRSTPDTKKIPENYIYETVFRDVPRHIPSDPTMPGLLTYVSDGLGKTQYLSRSAHAVLFVSDKISRNKIYLTRLLQAGFHVITSDPSVLNYDLPMLSILPESIRGASSHYSIAVTRGVPICDVMNTHLLCSTSLEYARM